MIITLALSLACGLGADCLLRMINTGLKDLLTVTATEIFHPGGSEHPGGFLSETPLGLTRRQRKSMGCSYRKKTTRLCGVALSTRLLDLLGWIGDRLSLGPSVYVRIYNAFGSKSDRIDARKLAELLYLNKLNSVYHGEHGIRTLKELVRTYLTITKDVTRVMNRLKALYRSWGIACAHKEVYAPAHRSEWLGKITEAGVRRRAEHYYQQLDVLRLLRQEVRRDLLEEGKKHMAWKLLRQIPGIGPIRAALSIALIQTPHRFRTKRQLWTYSGLGLETHDSAQYRVVEGQLQRCKKPVTLRGLNENHNHDRKDLFKGAAMRASTAAGPFHDFYQALLAKGRKPTLARLTLARKIAAITLIVWKKGVGFDANHLKPQAA